MNISDIPDHLWDRVPQIVPNNIQVRLRLSQHNLQFLDKMELLNVDRNSLVNLAIELIKPKFNGHGYSIENLENYIKYKG
jgi:hypothetical protein